MIGDCAPAEYRIVPPGPHVPPRPKEVSANACTDASFTSTDFSFVSAKNPRDLPSGDQKGNVAPSVPCMGRASTEFIGRTQIIVLPSAPVAVNASDVPSVEATGGPALSPARFSDIFSGGLITVRMERAGGVGRCSSQPTAAPSSSAASAPAAHEIRSRLCDSGTGAAAATAAV